jgi:hypothetical protein
MSKETEDKARTARYLNEKAGDAGPGGLQYAGLNALMGQLAGAISSLNAPVRVRSRCLSEARRQAAESWRGPRLIQPRVRSGARLGILWLSAAAVVALAAISLTAFGPFHLKSLARFLPGERPSASIPLRAENNSPMASDDSVAATSTDYVSLPYSDPSIANGTETMVEVSMPVSQLMAWGVPAPGRGPDDLIPVDLVLGDDGLPRAVEVLQTTSDTSFTEELYP